MKVALSLRRGSGLISMKRGSVRDYLAGKLYSVTQAAILSSPRQKEKARRNGRAFLA